MYRIKELNVSMVYTNIETGEIYEKCPVEVIYEVEAASKKEARSMFIDLNYQHEVERVLETDYIPTGNIDVKEIKGEN